LLLPCDELPFEFGGEAVAGPAGEGVSFEEAEVADRGFGEVAQGLPAVEGEDAPAGCVGRVTAPIEGGLPALGLEGVPAFGQPEFGAGIAVGLDEGKVLGTGDGAGGEAEGGKVDSVAGSFVIKGEGFEIFLVGGDTDFDDAGVGGGAGGEAEPLERRDVL
jgi:hypothetical protein